MKMECRKCGNEIKNRERFCSNCGFPVSAFPKSAEKTPLHSFYVDVESGVVMVNGKEINHVTVLDFKFENGKYSLVITYDDVFKATHLSGM